MCNYVVIYALQAGFLKVEFIPCDSKGNEDVDVYVDDPLDMVSLHRSINIPYNINKAELHNFMDTN